MIKELKICFGVIACLLLHTLFVPPARPDDPAGGERTTNPYLVSTFWEDDKQIDEIIVPGRPPKDFRMPRAKIPEPDPEAGTNTLSNVPAFDWCYGCSATSAAMMMGYYDRIGYSNMYSGPTNGGVCPLNNTAWGSGECPLSATHQGYDGLGVKGHVDDYWYSYGSTTDPYYGNWTEHGYADCTADFMGTNQWHNWQNTDGSTRFYFYSNGNPLYDYSGCEPTKRDGCHGLKLFIESRGYSVQVNGNYNQYRKGYGSDPNKGFTFEQYQDEIDAGRPVLIHVVDHTMLGFGYNTTGNKVYLHDTWDHSQHEMTWGGTYSELTHTGVTVILIEAGVPTPTPPTPTTTPTPSIPTPTPTPTTPPPIPTATPTPTTPPPTPTPPPYIDIGLRGYDGSQTVYFAIEPDQPATSRLRIHKNGTTHGIVLVDPGDPNASKFKIKTGDGIKAIRKLE